MRCRICCCCFGCCVGIKDPGPVEDLGHREALALAQRSAAVHPHRVAHLALAGLIVSLHPRVQPNKEQRGSR